MFKLTVDPRFGDINAMKHANSIAAAMWFEHARNPVFRIFIPDLDLSHEKWNLIMARTVYEYNSQIVYGSEVDIHTYISKIGNSSFRITQEAWQNGEIRATCVSTVVHFDFITKKSIPIPDDIRKILEEHLQEENAGN